VLCEPCAALFSAVDIQVGVVVVEDEEVEVLRRNVLSEVALYKLRKVSK
jgi:hypothetical protein